MVIYEKEIKRLVIPTGEGDGAYGRPCDCSEAYQSGYTEGYNQGQADCSGCHLTSASIGVSEIESTHTPPQGYEGFSTVSIDASDVYNQGYAAGQADCPECSGSSCNLEAGVLNLIADGPTWTMSPSSGYDGWNSLTVNDMGYGQKKYNSGYTNGFADGQASCPECDCSSAVTEAYQSGYTAGLNDCSGGSCTLVEGQFDISVGWDGNTVVNPPSSADGFSSFTIVDDGWGEQLYDSGFDEGYQSGYTDGSADAYQSGYTDGYQSGHTDGYTEGFADAGTCDCTTSNEIAYQSGNTEGKRVGFKRGYEAGEQSVIKSFLAGNDLGDVGWQYGTINYYNYGIVVAYYYTPISQYCVITGYDRNCPERWTDAFSSMSVDGGNWQIPTLYYWLSEGWHQIRFVVKDHDLHYAFDHDFPTEEINGAVPYMDALKAVSIPEANGNQSGVTSPCIATFKNNTGIRILSTSQQSIGGQNNGGALDGATNLNVIVSHYGGSGNFSVSGDVQSGVLFYPEGKSSTHASTLQNWTKIELF